MSRTALPRFLRDTYLVLMLLSLAALQPALAQWKWRDAKGQVQYSDRPPPADLPEKNILQRPPGFDRPASVTVTQLGGTPAASAAGASAAAPSSAGPRGKLNEAAIEARRREAQAAEESQRAADLAKQAKQQADNCQRARDYARTLESGVRIARVDANGERVFVDDAQRAQELNRAREVMASDCK